MSLPSAGNQGQDKLGQDGEEDSAFSLTHDWPLSFWPCPTITLILTIWLVYIHFTV